MVQFIDEPMVLDVFILLVESIVPDKVYSLRDT
jgi:hypothetical protein